MKTYKRRRIPNNNVIKKSRQENSYEKHARPGKERKSMMKRALNYPVTRLSFLIHIVSKQKMEIWDNKGSNTYIPWRISYASPTPRKEFLRFLASFVLLFYHLPFNSSLGPNIISFQKPILKNAWRTRISYSLKAVRIIPWNNSFLTDRFRLMNDGLIDKTPAIICIIKTDLWIHREYLFYH